MRPRGNHHRSERQSRKRWHDGMAKHVNAVMKRAKERRTTLTDTYRRVPQRLTQPISPHKRLKERAGLWMFVKQSEVQEDVRAVMAEDSHDRRQMWNRACQKVEGSINCNALFPMLSSADNIFGAPSFKNDKELCLFPADPSLLDYAERILSTLPQLNLRNDDTTSYSVAATGIVACSLRRNGIYPKGSSFQEKERLESSEKENGTHEKFWRSFFENLSPLNSFSADSTPLTSNSSSAKLFEFEDIPASSGHVLSDSDGVNISDVYQSSDSLSNNMSDCSFDDFVPKIGENSVGSVANLSINSNDLMKLIIDEDISTNISCNSPSQQPKFELKEYRPISVSAWFERDSANMLNTSKASCRNSKKDKAWLGCPPMECSSNKSLINEIVKKRQRMNNSLVRRKSRSNTPDFHFKSNHETYNAFDSICHSQTSHFSFDF
uniref:BHLH domain-containing protein n=1 Tax=Elaeophora elaphi TaxID=1147741 RepID=A0A0R3RT67_9BILA